MLTVVAEDIVQESGDELDIMNGCETCGLLSIHGISSAHTNVVTDSHKG
jgi:hypothetical protein